MSLKNLWCSAPVLDYPKFKKTFIAQTDTSDVGFGAVLAQVENVGKEQVIPYASRTLPNKERSGLSYWFRYPTFSSLLIRS